MGCAIFVYAILGVDVAVVVCPVFAEFGDGDGVAVCIFAMGTKGPEFECVVEVADDVGIEDGWFATYTCLLVDVIHDFGITLFALNGEGAIDCVGAGWWFGGCMGPVEDVVGEGSVVGV